MLHRTDRENKTTTTTTIKIIKTRFKEELNVLKFMELLSGKSNSEGDFFSSVPRVSHERTADGA